MEENKEFALNIKTIENDVFFTTFGKNSRIELKNCLSIDKIGILIQKFNDSKVQTACVTTFVDSSKALVLAQDILSGRLAKIASSKPELETLYESQGGKKDKDGKIIYRSFRISHGKKWLFSNYSGPGKVTSTGGYAAAGEFTQKVSIGLDNESLKAIALKIQAEYQAYRTVQIIKELKKGK